MWECQICGKRMDDKMGVELRFGYVDSSLDSDPYEAFVVEEEVGPVCGECAIRYIKGKVT